MTTATTARTCRCSASRSLTGIPTAGRFGATRTCCSSRTSSYELNQFALFGEGHLDGHDRFDLTGGLRYYDFEEDREQIFDGIFADNPATALGSRDVSADGFAPRVIASYKADARTRASTPRSRRASASAASTIRSTCRSARRRTW
jgi:outer membrane receptor protein involved in Fe transport